MYRTIVQLTDAQKSIIALICKREQISQSALIRAAIDALIASNQHLKTKPDVFGIWAKNNIAAQKNDGLEYQRKLRQEWDDTSGI